MAVAAGPNASLVLGTDIRAGVVPLAQQLGSGVPGLPQPGSLMAQDLEARGLVPQGYNPPTGFTTIARSMATVPVASPTVQSTQARGSVPPKVPSSTVVSTAPPSWLSMFSQGGYTPSSGSSVQSGTGSSPTMQTAPDASNQVTSTNIQGQAQNTTTPATGINWLPILLIGGVVAFMMFSGGSSSERYR